MINSSADVTLSNAVPTVHQTLYSLSKVVTMLGLVEAFACIALMGCGGGGGGDDGSSISVAGSGGGTGAPAPTTAAAPAALASGVIQPSLVPSRTSGVAPLAVHFDATGTIAAAGIDVFRQVTYAFNFGDDRGQSWAVSGKPKNTEVGGPIAAHVFDLPGTYSVRLRATDASGNAAETSVTVTVQDPAVFYSGTKTVCVSMNTDFSDCPAGAAQQNRFPSGIGWNGKRVLLKRNQNYTALGNIDIYDGNSAVQIGAFGRGENPVVAAVNIGNTRPNTANFANDITVMDLATARGMYQSIGSRVLFYRNNLNSTDSSASNRIFIGYGQYWALQDPYRSVPSDQFYIAREIFLVENNIVGKADGNIFGDGSRVALLGNVVGRADYHSIRLVGLHKSILAHNEVMGISASGWTHALKLHSGGLGAYSDSYPIAGTTWATSKVIIVNNLFGNASDNNAWTVAICPQNDQSAEGASDILVELNRFVKGMGTSTSLILTSQRATYRNNTRTDGSTMTYGLDGHSLSLPASWKGPYFSY